MENDGAGAGGPGRRATRAPRRLRVGCDLGLAVTGIGPQDPTKPDSPLVTFLALADGTRTVALEIHLTGDPAIQRSRTAKSALDLVRQRLLP